MMVPGIALKRDWKRCEGRNGHANKYQGGQEVCLSFSIGGKRIDIETNCGMNE